MISVSVTVTFTVPANFRALALFDTCKVLVFLDPETLHASQDNAETSISSNKPSATQKLLRSMSLKSATMKVALVKLINHFLGW